MSKWYRYSDYSNIDSNRYLILQICLNDSYCEYDIVKYRDGKFVNNNGMAYTCENKYWCYIDEPPTVLDKISFMQSELVGFFWGYYDSHMEFQDTNFNEYRTIKPSQFHTLEAGVCWDYTAYIANQLEKLGFTNTLGKLNNREYSMIYMQDEEGNHTHTFVALKFNNNIYCVESAWKNNSGLHQFTSEEKYILWYKELFIKENNTNTVLVYKYKDDKKYGKNCDEFMKYCRSFEEWVI